MTPAQEYDAESQAEYKAFKLEQNKIKREKIQRKKAEKKKKVELYKYLNSIKSIGCKKNVFSIKSEIERQQIKEQKEKKQIDFKEKSIKDFLHSVK